MELKFCPRCGESSFRALSLKEWQCDKCGFQYFHNAAAAVVVIIECKGDVLLTRRNQQPGFGLLDLPGGFVDPGESFEQALEREIQEELSISLSKPAYLSSFANRYPYGGITYRTSDAVFVERMSERPNLSLAEDEISEIVWQPLQLIQQKDIAFESCWQALSLFQEQQKSQS